MKTKRLLITILAFACLIALVLLAVKGLEIDSVERLQEIVINSGVWGILLFILFNWLFMLGQFLPTAIVNIAGVFAFGLWYGILWSLVAVLSGALLLFLLGRKFGTKIAKWVVGEENTDEWRQKITRGKYTLFILLLFPASPDSLLYVLAGMTKLKTRTYLLILLLSKPIGVVTTCLLGGGAIIPISWAYAWLWAILGLVMGFAIYLSIKYQDKIDKFVMRLTKRV